MEVSQLSDIGSSIEPTPANSQKLAKSLAELLPSGDSPLVLHVLNLKQVELFERDEGYEMPASVRRFFRTIVSTYQGVDVTTTTK